MIIIMLKFNFTSCPKYATQKKNVYMTYDTHMRYEAFTWNTYWSNVFNKLQ